MPSSGESRSRLLSPSSLRRRLSDVVEAAAPAVSMMNGRDTALSIGTCRGLPLRRRLRTRLGGHEETCPTESVAVRIAAPDFYDQVRPA